MNQLQLAVCQAHDDSLILKGVYEFEHFRDGKKIGQYRIENAVVNVGKNKILDIMFNGVTPLTTWYMGLVDNAGFSAFAAADTMASHAGWAESTAYTESTRPQWTVGSASSQSVTNATPVTFDINATGTMNGIFIISDNTKGGTSGTLWGEGSFSSTVSVNNGDQLKGTYTLSC